MKILISGGSGFLGRAFSERLQTQSDRVTDITWLSRDKSQEHPDYVTMMSYDEFQFTQTGFDVILNLAGASIADQRWTDKRKQLLFDSRLMPTQAIIDYIARVQNKPKLLVSGSAIGWYGVRGDTALDENSGYDVALNTDDKGDFPHELCDRWEAEACSAIGLGVPVVLLRTGIVLHPDGGMLAKVLPPFKMGAGGKLGDGHQIMSWISRDDWVSATWFIINKELNQDESSNSQSPLNKSKPIIYNLTAPNPVENVEFTQAIGKWLHRPTVMTLPKWLLKSMFGEMSTLLVDGQKVLPQALLEAGFEFQHPTIDTALNETV